MNQQLPAELKSLYRLFLRTASATVLHHPQASRNLRRLWRPVFDAAASVTNEFQQSPIGSPERQLHASWLGLWERRMNNTLGLLYNSSQTRGLSHNLTRNLALLVHHEQQRIRSYRLKAWDPQRPQMFTDLSPKTKKRQEEDRKFQEFVARSWGPLNQVVQLAEAKDDLTLGRIMAKGWKARFMRERGL